MPTVGVVDGNFLKFSYVHFSLELVSHLYLYIEQLCMYHKKFENLQIIMKTHGVRQNKTPLHFSYISIFNLAFAFYQMVEIIIV